MIAWNQLGFKTLFIKEVRRYLNVWKQTVVSPLVTTSLYFLVFGVALGSRLKTVNGVPYIEFVLPGLMMLSMISTSFMNTSSSLFQSKTNGTLIDLLVAPIGTREILTAYVAAALTRAFIVGALVYAVSVCFAGARVEHPFWVLFFSVVVCASFAFLGLLTAVWARKYDHLSAIPSFVLTPMTFLGGVFYSVSMLPEPWSTVSHLNPILYMVNGLRYGLLGVSDVSVGASALFVTVLMVVLGAITARVLNTGWGLRD